MERLAYSFAFLPLHRSVLFKDSHMESSFCDNTNVMVTIVSSVDLSILE